MDAGRTYDVAVLGAGAAGLWSCHELTRAGADVLLVSAPDEQGYASTRNQGWLHSGALFALFDAQRNAQECIAGARIVRDLAREAAHAGDDEAGARVVHDIPFRYVFDGSADLAARRDQCARAGIEVVDDDPADLTDLFGRPVRTLLAPDGVTDNSALLRLLARRSHRQGLSVVRVPRLEALDLDPDADGSWSVRGPGLRARAGRVVLAGGPLGPTLVDRVHRRHGLEQRPDLEVTRTTVLCVHDTMSEAALICIDGGPHIVPFRAPDGSRGATICIPFDNTPSDPAMVHVPPSASEQRAFLGALDATVPGLAASLRRPGVAATWYACQKLIPSASSGRPDWRHNVLEQLAPGLFLTYAGKFTTAPLLGRQVAATCSGTRTGPVAGPGALGSAHEVVASQPFTRPATHRLVERDRRLHSVPSDAR